MTRAYENEEYKTMAEKAKKIAAAIREADAWDECENECCEICRLAGMESEWHEADGDTFENVVYRAAEKLGVNI